MNLGLDLKVLSNVDYGVAVSDGVLFSIPDEAKAYYPGLGFDFGAPRLTYLDAPHSRGVSDRKPDPERFCRTGLHGPQGADPNSRIVAAGRAERVAALPTPFPMRASSTVARRRRPGSSQTARGGLGLIGTQRAPCETPSAIPPSGRDPRWVLPTSILGSSLGFIDSSVVNVALPRMQSELATGFVTSQWIVNGYMLMLASLILFGGSVGDAFGQRRTFIFGLAGFASASVACGLALELHHIAGRAYGDISFWAWLICLSCWSNTSASSRPSSLQSTARGKTEARRTAVTDDRLPESSPSLPEPDRLPVAVRAYVPPPPPKPSAESSRKTRSGKPTPPSEWTLVFDTETTVDAAQRLRIGAYQFRKGDEMDEGGSSTIRPSSATKN